MFLEKAMSHRFVTLSSLLLTLGVAACLGGSAKVGGTLSGLPSGNSVTLQNNGADNLTLNQNGSFQFDGMIDGAKAYSVTVLTQPASATCSVANGSGNIDSAGRDVTNVAVTCVSTASITGTVSGLGSGTSVTLINGSNTLVIASNGSFAFSGVLAAGTAYNVTVSTQPAGQSCSVAGGSGTVVAGTPTNIVVTCV